MSEGESAEAHVALTQLEQLRWVLGNLLEIKDLPSLWPIRIVLTHEASESPAGAPDGFVLRNGQFLRVSTPGAPVPLGQVASLLLDANTPRLPPDVESGLRSLFSTLEAHGSRVTWGGAPAHPDLAWARMQLFATKFEYGASFHIFLTALRGGSTLAAAERNAFGKSSEALEAEARVNLAAGKWSAVPVSGRPLDPKRDFGQHSIESALADVYLADWIAASDPRKAEQAYKLAVETGGTIAPLGYEGLGEVARLTSKNPAQFWDDAVRAGSHSAPVYVAAAEGLPASEALPLLKKASQLNERWAEPVYQQVQFAATPAEKESLLTAALKLDPRATAYWIELAQLQTEAGQATAAQGSWLRAEDSAPDETQREHVHQLALSSEQQRLDAAEKAQQRDRDAVHLADEQAQKAEAERIRAAEQKANRSLDSASGEDKPADAVEWSSLVGQKKLNGSLARVDCLKKGWRLWVKDKEGNQTQLFLSKETPADLACGPQTRPRRVSVQYRPVPDEDLHTAGEIVTLQIQ